ncbi:MAG TPA: MBL fold metallo-hydrolase [Anaeromyxobacteraceae bacterium]|nr:MBL fold metallo-hydrolase [Anaeromyxobacteraceae bacterium]
MSLDRSDQGTGGRHAPRQDRQPVGADGRFVNLDGSTPQSLGAVLRWGVWDRLTGVRRRGPAGIPAPSVEADLALLGRPPEPGEPARLTWLGHASWLVQLDGVSLLVDPVLGPQIYGGIRRSVAPGIAPGALPPVDAALVSHSHYDHLDLPTLAAVKAPVVAGLGLADLFEAQGLAATELGWWRSATVGGVRITFVPSQHWSRRGLRDQNATLWGGFAIEGRAARIYHSGDTAYFDGFREIGARFPGIDAALLPIGAYDPAWFMEKQHMNPEQALQAFADLGAHTFVAMHWGTFKLTDEPLDEPPRRLEVERRRRALPLERVRLLAVGETIEVGGGAPAIAPAPPAHPRG